MVLMSLSANALSQNEVMSVLDTFAQLKDGGKLCFKNNEVSIESSSSVMRTAYSFVSYALGSGWSREISNLTNVIQKLTTFFDQVGSDDELYLHEVVILAHKIQSAVDGLEVLKTVYSSKDKEVQNKTVEAAISQLRNISLKMRDRIILFGQQIGQQISTLKSENLAIRRELEETKKSLGMKINLLATENQELRLELEKTKTLLHREAVRKQEEIAQKIAEDTKACGEELDPAVAAEEEDNTRVAKEREFVESFTKFSRAFAQDVKENDEFMKKCKRELDDFAEVLKNPAAFSDSAVSDDSGSKRS